MLHDPSESPNSMSETQEIKSKLQVTCRNCSMSELCIPRGLQRDDIERIGNIVSRKKTLQKGEYLYRKGDRFRGILAIKAGTAKLVTMDSGGNEYLTGYLLPGELLGFDALSDDRHSCSAMALETLSYCELPAEQLDALCRDVPNLLRELFRHAGNTLVAETRQVVLSKRPADERVAGFLLNLSDRLSQRGFSAQDFRLSLTRQEIGNFLGLALETVSRTLKSFEDAGLIGVNNKHIHIADLSGLRLLCEHRDE
jgi:CRP/FNR family transcriptional regulator